MATSHHALRPKAGSALAKEATALIGLAVPIAISQVSRVGMNVVDTVFAGNVSATGLAAVGLATSIWFAIFFFVSGVLIMAQALLASRTTTNDPVIVNRTAEQVWLNSMFWGLISSVLLLGAALAVPFAGLEAAVADLVSSFLFVIALGAPACTLFQGLKFSFDGAGEPGRGMRIGVLGFLINIPLNFLLVFGLPGVDGLGVIGSAWATTATYWLMLIALIRSSMKEPIAPGTRMAFWPRPDRSDQHYLLTKGIPTGIAILLDAGFFSAIAWVAVKFGTATMAANQIVLSFISLLFVGQIALSMAISIRVAGAEGGERKRQIARTGTLLSIGLSLIYVLVITTGATMIVRPYSADPEVTRIALGILSVAVLFQLVDAVQACAAGALRGMHDTFVPMLIAGTAYWIIALPIALLLVHTDLIMSGASITDVWVGLAIGISTAALLLTARFLLLTRRRPERSEVS